MVILATSKLRVLASPVMHPPFIGSTTQLECAFANRTELFHDAFRCVIGRPNETRGTSYGEVLEQPIASRPRCFGREALSPIGSVERVGDLWFWPVERLEDADASDKCALANS